MSEHQMLHMTAFFVYGSESYRLFGVKELSLTWGQRKSTGGVFYFIVFCIFAL